MKVLLATATYPTTDRPSAGIFVRSQFRFFKRHATPEEEFTSFKVRTHTKNAPRSLPHIFWSLIKFIPHLFRRYDVVHVHFVSPLIFIAVFYKRLHPKTRLMLSVHGSGLFGLEKKSNARKNRYAKAIRKFDRVILAGESLQAPMQRYATPEQCRIICAGVDDLRFYKDDDAAKEFDFIFVGSFTTTKGVDILLSALEMLDQEEIRVCFVGSGSLQHKLQLAGHHLNIRIFADVPQRRLRQLYNSSRFLIFPSRGDGFGLVVSEAMYCGTPPIIFNESGAKAQVASNENGICYKPNTAEKLCRVLMSAFQMEPEEYVRLSNNARQANVEYSLSHVGTQLMSLYRQLAAEADLTPDGKAI